MCWQHALDRTGTEESLRVIADFHPRRDWLVDFLSSLSMGESSCDSRMRTGEAAPDTTGEMKIETVADGPGQPEVDQHLPVRMSKLRHHDPALRRASSN